LQNVPRYTFKLGDISLLQYYGRSDYAKTCVIKNRLTDQDRVKVTAIRYRTITVYSTPEFL